MGCHGSKYASGSTSTPNPSGKMQSLKSGGRAGSVSHANFIFDNRGKIHDSYEVDKRKIGEGSYGSVCQAKNKNSGAVRAVKSILKGNVKNIDRFKQEIQIMKLMDHPQIVKLYESFEDHRNIYLIMELCCGGELFDRILEAGHFKESSAAVIMQQIIRAIFYMHEISVCHRDLKPENFLFKDKGPIEQNTLKIIDFGLSCKFKQGQIMTTQAGTPYYVAPQVLSGKYDHMSDLWSVGVIMYVLLCGYPPFFGDTDAQVLSKVRQGKFTFNNSDWKNVSDDAKNLITELLKMNPRERYTAEMALNHIWIKNTAPKASRVSLPNNLLDNLRGFRGQNKLKKAALHVIAGQLNEDQIRALRETFMSLDGNGDGLLTAAEMRSGLAEAGIEEVPADLQQILEDVDSDGSGVIDYTEFLAATLERRHYLTEDVCWAAFRVFDLDGDGRITLAELQKVLESGDVDAVADKQALGKMLDDIDDNGDGAIDFAEFMQMMQQG